MIELHRCPCTQKYTKSYVGVPGQLVDARDCFSLSQHHKKKEDKLKYNTSSYCYPYQFKTMYLGQYNIGSFSKHLISVNKNLFLSKING